MLYYEPFQKYMALAKTMKYVVYEVASICYQHLTQKRCLLLEIFRLSTIFLLIILYTRGDILSIDQRQGISRESVTEMQIYNKRIAFF